ncbi:MAG TPA: hypothetical protein VIK83_01075 [Coriobacteriia bacterium]
MELRYATPGLRTGILISIVALLLALALAVATERRLASARRVREGGVRNAAGGSANV